MPRLSEPMREALEAAATNQCLRSPFGTWRPSGGGRRIAHPTIVALTRRGLLRQEGNTRVITPAGREAIGQPLPSPPETDNG